LNEGPGRLPGFPYQKDLVAAMKPARRVMKNITQKIKEHKCAACNGTGFPVVRQPPLATHRIYPVKCEACAGKGRITDAN
jgi:hypothetical protein